MDAKRFGAFIAERRKEKHMTQAQLGQRLHVTDKAVSRWERGVGLPDIGTLEPLAEALEISVLELMRGEKLPERPVTDAEAAAAIVCTLELARRQRRQEYRSIAVISLIAIGFTVLLFLSDWLVSEPYGLSRLLFYYTPIACMVGGLLLLLWGLIRKLRGLSWGRTAAAGLLALVILTAVMLLLCFGFWLLRPGL